MQYTDTVIIGGGQAGLAMSRCLWERGVKHVVLERGRVGERWRSERWDSLRLLTPNWHSRLPHFHYDGDEPERDAIVRSVIRLWRMLDEHHDARRDTRRAALVRTIEEELKRLGGDPPQDGSLKDPDRLEQLKGLLSDVRRSNVAVDDFFYDRGKVV